MGVLFLGRRPDLQDRWVYGKKEDAVAPLSADKTQTVHMGDRVIDETRRDKQET